MNKFAIPRIQIAGVISSEELLCIDSIAEISRYKVSAGLLFGNSEHMNEPALPSLEIKRFVAGKLLKNINLVLITYFNRASQIIKAMNETGVSILQLHGPISKLELERFRAEDKESILIKSLPIDISIPQRQAATKAIKECEYYQNYVDAFITDTQTIVQGELRFGATGNVHPWAISKKIVQSTALPVIVAGGLNSDNVSSAIKSTNAYGVDAHSGLEVKDANLPKAQWRKDFKKVRSFIANSDKALSKAN